MSSQARILDEVQRKGTSGNPLHLTADAAGVVSKALADRQHMTALLRAVVAYDEVNQSDLPLPLLDQIRAAVDSAGLDYYGRCSCGWRYEATEVATSDADLAIGENLRPLTKRNRALRARAEAALARSADMEARIRALADEWRVVTSAVLPTDAHGLDHGYKAGIQTCATQLDRALEAHVPSQPKNTMRDVIDPGEVPA